MTRVVWWWSRAGEDPHLNLPPQTGEEVGGDAPGGRVVRAAVVRDVARCGGRRCPAPFPARRPQGTPLRFGKGRPCGGRPQGTGPVAGGHKGSPLRFGKGRPCGGRPQGIAPVAGGHKGSPLRRSATRDRPCGGRPQGIAPTEVGHKGSALWRAATRDRPYGWAATGDCPCGGRPQGIAPTRGRPCGGRVGGGVARAAGYCIFLRAVRLSGNLWSWQ